MVQELQGPQELNQTKEKEPQGKVDTPLCQGRNLISLSEIMIRQSLFGTLLSIIASIYIIAMLIQVSLRGLILKESLVARFGEHYGDYIHHDQT